MFFLLFFKLNARGKPNVGADVQSDVAKSNEHVTQELSSPATETEVDVDESIDQCIQINSNKQMRMEYLYPWTLKFKDSTQESKYCQLREEMFRSNMLCVFIVWVFIVSCQIFIIPWCTILVVCLALSTVLLTAGCILVMAEEFLFLPMFLQKWSAALVHQRNCRTLFICSVIFLMSVASCIGLFTCPMDHADASLHKLNYAGSRASPNISRIMNAQNSNASKQQQFMPAELNRLDIIDKVANMTPIKNGILPDGIIDSMRIVHAEPCSHPEYFVFTWVLCLIALATGLKLYYLVKTFMAMIMVCCYAILISITFPDVFTNASTESEGNAKYGMPLTARMNILLIVFLTMVTYHARLVEVTSRLDFIWKEQAEKELTNMKSNRILNDLLIKVCQSRLSQRQFLFYVNFY